ncbi:unnamed protein product [Paramecium octaurelia]|uniref:Uncharacterized protein n=1 Tax=Paramecium octaurelia TaxID=43137 RepID=A0A8S1VS26_PAROT|nr:unnamed protein product [Paramecium octaurelia]
MQTQEFEKKICQVHKLDIIAFDLKSQTRIQDKYLCSRCMAEKIDKENLTLLNETVEMIYSMKNQASKLNKEENCLRLINIKQLQSSIKSFKDYIKTDLNKLLQLIDLQIEQIQIEIESKETKQEIKNLEEDQLILSKYYNGDHSFTIPIEQSLQETDMALVQLVQESLLSQSKSQHFKEIMESIDKIKITTPKIQQLNVNKLPSKEFEKHKTPCLNQLCTKHNKEIIMLNLDVNKPEFSRLACVECIEDCPIQYISLKKANKRWNEFTQQQDDLISKYNSKRKNIQYNYERNQVTLGLLQQLIIRNFINLENKQIFEFDDKQIEKIVDLLSQKDKNKHILEKQEKQERLDYLFYQSIKQKLDCLIKHDLLCKQQLIKIMQQQDIEYSERTSSFVNKQSSEVQEFISKCQLQGQYLSIFNESVDLQMEIQKDAYSLQQQGQLDQLIVLDDNKNEGAQLSQLQQQYKQFEINSEKMKKLIKAEENDEQLKIIKKQKDELHLQIEDEKLVFKEIQQKISCLEEVTTSQISELNQKVSKQEQQQQDLSQQINQEIVMGNQLKENLKQLSNSSEQKLYQLTTKYDELNKQIDEAQQDIYQMKNSTMLQDNLQSLENSMDSKYKVVHEKIDQLTNQIQQNNIEQNTKQEQQQQEVLKQINDEKIATNSQFEQQNQKLEQITKEKS